VWPADLGATSVIETAGTVIGTLRRKVSDLGGTRS
jgi:hypothetical protein